MKYLVSLLFIVPNGATAQSLFEEKALVAEVSFWQYNNTPSVQINTGVVGKFAHSYVTLGAYFSYEQHSEVVPDNRNLAMKQYYGILESGIQVPLLGITTQLTTGLLYGADQVMIGDQQKGGANYGVRTTLKVGKQWHKNVLYFYFNRTQLRYNYLRSELNMIYPSIGVSYFSSSVILLLNHLKF